MNAGIVREDLSLRMCGGFSRIGATSCAMSVALLVGCAAPATAPAPAPAQVAPAPAAAPAPAPPPAPSPAQIQRELEQAAQKDLEEGTVLYDKGDYNSAVDRLTNSTAIAAGPVGIRVAAHKYAAFSYCVTRRLTQCRAQFDSAFKLDPAFDLAPAERGHPLWGPVFDRVKKAQPAAAKK